MARTFTGIASAYSANQMQPCRVRRQQIRTVTANFNGAIDPGRTIESVTWAANAPWCTRMSDAAIAADQRSTSVAVRFDYAGIGDVKATATLDDGSVVNYEFCFTVTDCPLYPSETYQSTDGPYSLTVVAP